MSESRVYEGWLVATSNGEEDGLLGLKTAPDDWDTEYLAELVMQDREEFGEYASVSYITADKALTEEERLTAIIGMQLGVLEADYNARYSDVTGYLWTDEALNVGGHDLLAELKSHIGRWLRLEIAFSREPVTST
jgi:hypothetical protein